MTFVISKTHVVAQQPCRTQPNTKFVVAKMQLFTINNNKKHSSTHHDFRTKLVLITTHSSTTTHAASVTKICTSCYTTVLHSKPGHWGPLGENFILEQLHKMHVNRHPHGYKHTIKKYIISTPQGDTE